MRVYETEIDGCDSKNVEKYVFLNLHKLNCRLDKLGRLCEQ